MRYLLLAGASMLALFQPLSAARANAVSWEFLATDHVVEWTAPSDGVYDITAMGAQGGGGAGGAGALVRGRFDLTAGETLDIAVGDRGQGGRAGWVYTSPYGPRVFGVHSSAGGGGGSFVVGPADAALLVAGGGGGASGSYGVQWDRGGSLLRLPSDPGGAGSAAAGSGVGGPSYAGGITYGPSGGGGGGFLSDGNAQLNTGSGAGGGGWASGLAGGAGGAPFFGGGPYGGNGGFGGGGGGGAYCGAGGGGGGYGGGSGGAGNYGVCGNGAGGGGGLSFNAGSDPVGRDGYRHGDGLVRIADRTVPEPAGLAVLAVGAVALAGARRRRG